MSNALDRLVKEFKEGKLAPHVYQSDGASRDPECAIKGCRWSWSKHLNPDLLKIVKEESK